MEVLNRSKTTKEERNQDSKKEKPNPKPSRWAMLRFLPSCLLFPWKVEQLNDSHRNQSTHHENREAVTCANEDHAPYASPLASPPWANDGGNTPPSLSNIELELHFSSHLRQFSFSELKYATRNFRPQMVIGQGGFGRVYKGWINEAGSTPMKPSRGLAVAVKTLNHEGRQGHREWLAEVNFLSKLHHPNLVKLVGYCIEGPQRVLVYEYMARGSLENHLFRRGAHLSWSIRIKVALDAAKGLAYLHEEAEKPVIYRDFKASNILLDVDFNAKLSDLGLAKDGPEGDKTHVSTRVMGTFGYAAPEYVRTGHLTCKSDVYSFGIVLLEILSGRKSVDKQKSKGSQNLLDWAWPYLRDKKQFLGIMDPKLQQCFPVNGARKAVQLAIQCIRPDPKTRPLMSHVVQILTPLSEISGYRQTSPLPRTRSSLSNQSLSPINIPRAADTSTTPTHRHQLSSTTPTHRHQLKSPRSPYLLSPPASTPQSPRA